MLTRRQAILGGGAVLVSAALPLARLFERTRHGTTGRFGPLVRDPKKVLDLPAGFSYRILQRSGDSMSDGYVAPSSFDGMGCFAGPRGTLVLMRNHENTWVPTSGPYRLGQSAPPEAFDSMAQGAVTRLVVREDSLDVVSSNLVLAGTVRNCAGGRSPWGWLSCEETTDTGHGYVFLCRPEAERVASPERIVPYGRCRHEAATVHPETLVAYLTEDKDDACLYRFVPTDANTPFNGTLQAMTVIGRPGLDTSQHLNVGDAFDVDWVNVDEPDPKDDTLRLQARARGAAIVKRGEGIWLEGDRLFVCSTTGGPKAAGQIFRVDVSRGREHDRLELLAQSTDTGLLNMPDNITAAPWGEIFMAEDSVIGDQFVRVLSTDGKVVDFARNAISQSELAGVCFSPDGRTLFLNIYTDGLTLAIRGPFRAT